MIEYRHDLEVVMTETDRARLERATRHPSYQEAMRRPPADYAVPVALLAVFYLVVPFLFLVPVLAADDLHQAALAGVVFFTVLLPAAPFAWGVLRTWPLRKLPARHVFGMVLGPAPAAGRGRWVTVEPATGAPVDLRLRLKAYLDSTGGAVGAGSVGVALCKGDQLVEWVAIPDQVPEAVS